MPPSPSASTAKPKITSSAAVPAIASSRVVALLRKLINEHPDKVASAVRNMIRDTKNR